MKIQTKIILFLLFIIAVAVTGVISLYFSDLHRMKILAEFRANEEKIVFDKALQQQTRSLELFAGDYSNWDEMVQFVQDRDRHWSVENIDDVIQKFNVQAAWVFTKDIDFVYSVNMTGDSSLRIGPLSFEVLHRILKLRSFNHFYIASSYGLMEVCSAPIQPSFDNERQTQPKGYFLVSRLWTPDYLGEISDITNKKVIWIPNAVEDSTFENDVPVTTLRIVHPVYGWDGKPVGHIQATQELTTIKEMIRLANFQLIVVILFSIAIIVPITFFLLFRVTRPFNLISKSLANQDKSAIQPMQNENSEFGEISRLLISFLDQKRMLLDEIENHKKTEKALERSERDYRELFEQAHDPILVIDADSANILAVNRRACETFGYPQSQFIGMPLHTIWKKQEMYEKLIAETMERGFYAGMEAVHFSRDGGSILLEINAAPIDYKTHNAILLVERDITERKLSEELNLSHAILKKVGNLILVANSQGRIIFVNHASQSILGYEPSELLGFGWWNLTRDEPEERIKEMDSIRKIAKGEIAPSEGGYERLVKRKDGSKCWILWHDFKGPEDLLIGVGYDVTERKKAEEALRESESHYRLLFEDNPIPVWVFDIETLRFLAVNDAAVAHYGYSREEFLNMTIKDIRPSEDIPLLMENMEEEKGVDQKKKSWRHRKKDGSMTDVEVTTHQLMFGDRRARLVLIDDITDRKKRELTELKLRMQKIRLAAIVQTQEEERRRIAKELHDGLGQVLSAVKRKLEYIVVQSRRAKTKDMQSEYENAISMVDSALVEARRMAHNLIPNVLQDFGLFEAIDRLCHQSFHNTKVKIHFQTFSFDRRLSSAAELGIYRIVQEAFQNILKHSDATEAALQIVDHPKKLVITIEDNGKGFDMQGVKRRPVGERGMGILSMRERVEFLNGNFHIYSSPGRGTSVIVEIPIEEHGHYEND